MSLSRWVSWFRATSWRSLLETAVSNLESVREKIGSNSSSTRLATPGLQDDDHWNMGILSYIFPKALLVHTFLFILAIRSQPFVRSSQSIAFWSFLKLSFYLYYLFLYVAGCCFRETQLSQIQFQSSGGEWSAEALHPPFQSQSLSIELRFTLKLHVPKTAKSRYFHRWENRWALLQIASMAPKQQVSSSHHRITSHRDTATTSPTHSHPQPVNIHHKLYQPQRVGSPNFGTINRKKYSSKSQPYSNTSLGSSHDQRPFKFPKWSWNRPVAPGGKRFSKGW